MTTRPNQPSVNNLTLKSQIAGTLCWTQLQEIDIPTTYICAINTTEFKISVSAKISETAFRYILDTGECYEGHLLTKEAEGVNQFIQIQ